MSQNGTENGISLTWKIRRVRSNYVCKFLCVCVCVCVHVCASVCVITLEIYSSSKFQVYNILLLTIVTMIPGQEDPLKK